MEGVSTLLTILGLLMTAVGSAVGLLFKQFASIRKDFEAEKDQRQRLELMIAREYVSQIALEKIMAPINKDMANMERLIERIANKLVIPAVHEE